MEETLDANTTEVLKVAQPESNRSVNEIKKPKLESISESTKTNTKDDPKIDKTPIPESSETSLETTKEAETDLQNKTSQPETSKSNSQLLPESTEKISKENDTSCEADTTKFDPQNVHYEGSIAIYTDKATGYQFQWDKDKNEWVPRSRGGSYDFEDDTHVYTDTDGTKLFWDKEKKAWFPKLTDDFMALYQMNYGFQDSKPKEEIMEENVIKKAVDDAPKVGEKRKATEPQWFEIDQTQNTNVYVSNLPLEIEEQEFVDLMQKCGLVMRDPQTGKFKIKLYRDPGTGDLKGDALCTYIKRESVDLALNLLDGYDYKNKKLKVERAKFELKGAYDPKLKPKMKKKKDKLKLKKQQEKLFDWRPEKKDSDRSKHERIVILKNLFDPKIFDEDVSLILEFQQDLREESGKIGEVRKVIIYDRHPEGVAQINMSSPEEADQVVKVMNGRWFMKRQLQAEIWDGKTKYKVAETDSEINQRLEGWDKFLEGESDESKEEKKNVND